MKKPEVNTVTVVVTPEMIAAWKEKYGADKVKLIELYRADGSDPIICYAKVPDRMVTSQYWQWMDKSLKKAGEILIQNCLLTNKELVLADEELFNTAATYLGQLIPIGRAEIKNC
jgi:hypothetical protein